MNGVGQEPQANVNIARIVYRLLTDARGWDIENLKNQLEISDRTFSKYLNILKTGIPELVDDGRPVVVRERTDSGTLLRIRDGAGLADEWSYTVRLTALELAARAFDFLRDTDLGQNIKQFRDSLHRVGDRTHLYKRLRRDLDRKLFYLPRAPKRYASKAQVLKVAIGALLEAQVIEIDYRADNPRIHEVEPLTLLMSDGGLYLVVRGRHSRKIYTLAVDRMESCRNTHQGFHYPPRSEYSPEQFTDGGFGVFQDGKGKPVHVELIFAAKPWLQRDLRERTWHRTQRFEDLPDGRLRMTFSVRTLVEVVRWVRSYGADVEVVGPPSLLEENGP